MPLVFQPDIRTVTREELEAHIVEVRARRMMAALALNESRNQKLLGHLQKYDRQIRRQEELLEKDILRLDAMIEKIEKRVSHITEFKVNAEQVTEQIDFIDPNEAGDEKEYDE